MMLTISAEEIRDKLAWCPTIDALVRMSTYGSLIAAINFDMSGTTRIGKYVLNHSFMIPGLIATPVTVVTGLAIAAIMLQLR